MYVILKAEMAISSVPSATPKLSFRPIIWLMGLLFFIAATPFELAQSGFAYLAKAGALGAILIYALVVRDARTGPLNLLTLLVLVSFLLTNLIAWSDRVAIALLTISAGTLLGQARGKQWDDDFRSILALFLTVHVCALAVAMLAYYATGDVLDLHGTIFPGDSRAEAYGSLARLSGFHTEPGTYSQWTLMALYLLALTAGRLLSYRHALIILSVLPTFSLWGWLAVGVFVFTFLIEAILMRGISAKVKALFGVLALGAFIGAGGMLSSTDLRESAVQFLSQKASLSTESGLDKLTAAQFFEENISYVLLIGKPLNPGFCPQCISPQDAGLGQNGIYYLGAILFAFLIISGVMQTIKLWNFSFAVPFLLILSWKANLYEPLLWVIFGYIFRGPPGGLSFSSRVAPVPKNSNSKY